MTPPPLPVWLLDIDGVVNALARAPLTQVWPADAWTQCLVRADVPGAGPMVLPILAARPVLQFVTDAVASGRVEVLWHSTWREAAVTDLAPVLGLPNIPISDAPEWLHPPMRWWKLAAAERVVAGGRPLVWTDDDIAVYVDQVGDLLHRRDALLISPDPLAGLTAAELDRIAAFLRL